MHARCRHPSCGSYEHYGGRGIEVCERWTGRGGYKNFLADMGERPEGTTLDRIDPDGHYEPTNCRWATDAEQRSNMRASDRWSRKHDVCLDCGTAERPHEARGLCSRCYQRKR